VQIKIIHITPHRLKFPIGKVIETLIPVISPRMDNHIDTVEDPFIVSLKSSVMFVR